MTFYLPRKKDVPMICAHGHGLRRVILWGCRLCFSRIFFFHVLHGLMWWMLLGAPMALGVVVALPIVMIRPLRKLARRPHPFVEVSE